MLAGVLFLGLIAIAAAVLLSAASDDDDDDQAPVATTPEPDPAAPAAPAAAKHPPDPAAVAAGDARPQARPPAAAKKTAPRSLDEIAWTTAAPSTLKELTGAWSIPRNVLAKLNPSLPANKRIKAGVEVVVYSRSLGESAPVGPPNNGRLTRGVPLPQDEAWALPADRSRAFATAETIAALLAGLDAYAQRFPEAAPIQVGDLSARRGGRIFGHQSHQTGLDVDIRLIENSTGDSFDADRNWVLVKSLIDGGDVTSIFLNATEQTWLRAAAEADVGAASAAEYFAIIRHEPGHTIHTHIRFVCPKQHKRCVNYPLPDTAEHDKKQKRKLPTLPGSKLKGTGSRLPRRRP